MKKSALTVTILLVGIYAFAQSNTFPTNGNAGIGTLSPNGSLQIVGPLDGSVSALIIGDPSPGNLNVPVGTSTGGYNIDFHTWRDMVPDQIGARIGAERMNNYQANTAYVQSMDLAFYTSTGWFQTDLTEQMRIKSNGNVGIGALNPISTFQVDDGCTKTSIGSADGLNLNYGTSYIGFNAARDANNNWSMSSDGLHNGGGVMYNDIFGNIYFSPIISSASNSASPQSLTDLNIKSNIAVKISNTGVLFAKQINVTLTGWPDYVFKKEYHLPTLTDVKAYIDQNHHLPEIPSAEQIAQDGLNLGAINTLLLKKVEELTLYTIASDKEIKDEKAVVQAQQEQIDQLKQQMDTLIKSLSKN